KSWTINPDPAAQPASAVGQAGNPMQGASGTQPAPASPNLLGTAPAAGSLSGAATSGSPAGIGGGSTYGSSQGGNLSAVRSTAPPPWPSTPQDSGLPSANTGATPGPSSGASSNYLSRDRQQTVPVMPPPGQGQDE